MSLPDRSIEPRIQQSARDEFIKNGFLNASLQEICRNAGVTTGALYKRFKGKEELFGALVDDTVAALEGVLEEKSLLCASPSDEELKKAWAMEREYMAWWFGFIYDRYDAMYLLLACSAGTKYAEFEHYWVENMSRATYAYYIEARRRGLTRKDISEKEMHVMLSAFWTAVCEPVVHGFTREEAMRVAALMCGLFDWYKMLGFER